MATTDKSLRSLPSESSTDRLAVVRAQWHSIQTFYSDVQECVDDAKVEELGRTRLPSVEAALNQVLTSLLEEKAEMSKEIYMGSCVASRVTESADGRDRVLASSFNEDAEVGFLPPCYRYLLGDHQKRLRELRRQQLAIQQQASKIAASKLDKSPGRLTGGRETDPKSTPSKAKADKETAKAASASAAAQRRLKVEQEELEMMGAAPPPVSIPIEPVVPAESSATRFPDSTETSTVLPNAVENAHSTNPAVVETSLQNRESSESNVNGSVDDGRELILSVCQYAKLDVPVGSRQVMLRFLTRFIREADIFPPLPLLSYNGKIPQSSPDAVRSIVSLVEREGFESIPSLLELFPELISVPLGDMIKRVGSAVDPSTSHPPRSYLTYKSTVRRADSEQRVSHSRRSSIGSHVSGAGHDDPNKHGTSELPAQPRSGASVPTRVSQYADRLEFVSLLHALAQKIEQKPELSKLFMYTVEVNANAAEEWAASVATHAKADGSATPASASGRNSVSGVRGGSSERWGHHEAAVSDCNSNSAVDDARPMLQKHSRCILLDFLPLYARDYAVGLALPQRDIASRLALEGILSLTRCTSPDVQDTVARESIIAYMVASEFRTTLLTLCKVPQNLESRTQLAYVIAVTRFWGTLVMRSPRVALAWDVQEVFATRILRDTILPLLKSTESRVYSAVCTLLATIVRELSDVSSLVESIVKTIFSARVVPSTGQIYVSASDAPSSATETASFTEEYIIARLKESPSVSWCGTSFAFSGSRTQAQQRPPVMQEAYVAMEATLVFLNSVAMSCPHYFLKYALGAQMESMKSVATKFHDLVDKYAVANGLGDGDDGQAQRNEGDTAKLAVAPRSPKQRSRRGRRQEKRSMLRAFGSRLCAMGLCSRGDTHITLSARVAAPPIVLAECFPARIGASSELCGSQEENFSEDILEKMLFIEANAPAEALIRRQRDLQVPIYTKHLPVKPAPLSGVAATAAGNGKAPPYNLRQVSSTFAGYGEEDMEVNIALLPSPATTPHLAGSSMSTFNRSVASAGGGASEAVESGSPTSPSVHNTAYLHRATGNTGTICSIAGSGPSNIWFHQGIHQAPVIVAVCGTVARMHELPVAINTSVTNLLSTLCLLPDLRVLYTLMDVEYGRLDHALHKLSSVIDGELEEDEQVQVAAAAAAIAHASVSGGMSSVFARGNPALAQESVVRGGGAPSPSMGKVSQIGSGGSSASTARSHSDPNSSHGWPNGMRSGGGQVMDNLTVLEHSRLQIFHWYCTLDEKSRVDLMYNLIGSAELQRKQDQLKNTLQAPPKQQQPLPPPAPTKSRGFFNFFSSGSNRGNEDRSSSSGANDVMSQSTGGTDITSRSSQESERKSLFTAAFLKHRYFIEACVCLEGFRHELNAIVAYTALSHNLLGLYM